MEAAFTKFRTAIAIAATIVMGAAMIQTIAPAAGEPARMPVSTMPAELLETRSGGAAIAAPPPCVAARSSAKRDRPFAAGSSAPLRSSIARPSRAT